jgi:hypothetical protein
MSSGTLYRVAQVRTNVSENISSPSSGFLKVITFHSCVIMESLLVSISVEESYVGSKNTVFWDVFTAVSVTDVFWDFVNSVVPVRTDDSKNISPPSSGFFRETGPHSCVAVGSLLISFSLEEHGTESRKTSIIDAPGQS